MKNPELKPLLVTTAEARRLLGIGQTTYWKLVKSGKIQTAEVAGRRLPVYASIEEYVQKSAA